MSSSRPSRGSSPPPCRPSDRRVTTAWPSASSPGRPPDRVTAMGLVDGHRALVTGGGSGIGRAACLRLAAEGASVAVLDRDARAAVAVAAEVNGLAFEVDVLDAAAVDGAVADAVSALGGLSIVFANAGIGDMAAIGDTSEEVWQRV